MELEHFSHDHKLLLNEKNHLNPDEEISCLCFICSLPIFSTPYYSCSGAGCNNFFLHKRCAHLPKRLKHVSRGNFRARVVTDDEFEFSCDKCGRKCDNVIWTPATRPAPIGHLDAFCAAPLELRIFHGSHEHVMVPVLGEDFFVCGACGLKHEERIRFRDEDEERIRSSIFYWCCWCSLWIHEHCATLPNYIRHVEHHDHPLALTYALPRGDQYSYYCRICGDSITSWGIYFCGTCSYYTHVKCATHRSELYKPVSSLEIGESGYWAQFPMANEDRSLVAYILDKTRLQINKEESSTNISSKHEHPLIFHATSENLGRSLCNGCIQPISAPYYSCSQCTNYLLHESCANLPPSILHPAHVEHPLVLLTNYNKSGFGCSGCWFECNGFSYRCERCDFELDVQCAFLPKSITHKAHDKRHIFHLIYVLNQRKSLNADCCGTDRIGEFQYICTGCDFLIHGFCAGLPLSVRHKYDKHPLKLIIGRVPITSDHRDNYFEEHKPDITTTTKQQQSYADDENFCEFCEKKIYNKHWYYDCAECNQSFHVECIPTVSKKSKFKLQARLNIPCHPHPLKGIRLLTDVSRSYRCGYCKDTIKNFEDELAFECLECDFTIHDDCALRNLCAKDKTC